MEDLVPSAPTPDEHRCLSFSTRKLAFLRKKGLHLRDVGDREIIPSPTPENDAEAGSGTKDPEEKIKRPGSSDHNPVKLHFPEQPNLNSLHLNQTSPEYFQIPSNTENCFLPKASSTQEIESQVRDLTSEILTAHDTASKPATHSNFPCTRQKHGEDHLTSLDNEICSLWGTAKAFRKKAAPISALNGPNGTALSDTNKTDVIANSLESQFKLNDIQNPHKDEIITNIVDAYLTTNINNTDPPLFPSEVITYIKKD
ncbi:hypothetical protein TNIN_111911 [Trichonephila inaurata madagascariensis]|uniref:Uncharacterized protein n=1 Tax=Trichonephila inaurata madagascariensis TaxID=2747483 RepID=A0A8X6X010_9ARAC|nr:hypothetical protein TNIN_111911 [Trichonephila inaurata madagascariensis]